MKNGMVRYMLRHLEFYLPNSKGNWGSVRQWCIVKHVWCNDDKKWQGMEFVARFENKSEADRKLRGLIQDTIDFSAAVLIKEPTEVLANGTKRGEIALVEDRFELRLKSAKKVVVTKGQPARKAAARFGWREDAMMDAVELLRSESARHEGGAS